MNTYRTESTLNKLSINAQLQVTCASKKKKEVPSPGEDEESGDDTDVPTHAAAQQFSLRPPPTPSRLDILDRDAFVNPYGTEQSDAPAARGRAAGEDGLGGKEDDAGALGVKAPKMTRARAYEERSRRRNQEKELERERGEAKREEAKRASCCWETGG